MFSDAGTIETSKGPIVAQIVATDENGLIGIGDKLPWGRVKEDMEFFKNKTLNHVVLMGYNTIHSLPRKLPQRHVIGLLSPNRSVADTDLTKFYAIADKAMLSVEDYIEDVEFPQDCLTDIVYIAGGGKVYENTLTQTDVVFRNVIVKDESIYPKEGEKIYYPLERLKQNFTLISWEDEALAYGGYMHKEIWVKGK